MADPVVTALRKTHDALHGMRNAVENFGAGVVDLAVQNQSPESEAVAQALVDALVPVRSIITELNVLVTSLEG